MMMITQENFAHFKTIIDKLIAQASEALDQVAETVKDRARLEHEALDREQVVERLNGEVAELQKRNRVIEERNAKLVDDLIALDSKVAEQDLILANIRKAANGEPKAA